MTKLQDFALFCLYQIQLIGFWGHPISLVVTVGLAWFIGTQLFAGTQWTSFYRIFEPIFPLLMSPLLIPLILREQHQRTLALVSATQTSLQNMFFVRILLTLLFFSGVIALLTFVFNLSVKQAPTIELPFTDLRTNCDYDIWSTDFLGGPNGMPAILLSFGAPTLFLGGLGTILAHLSADARVGYLSIFAFWMFNRVAMNMAEHPVFQYIYLFIRSVGLEGIEQNQVNYWIIPKLTQLLLGGALLLASSLLLRSPERYLRQP